MSIAPRRSSCVSSNDRPSCNAVTIALLIGFIDIEAIVYEDWWGPESAEKVEFYINNELKATFSSEPYLWRWNEVKFGKHIIKVIAYDDEGKSASKEIEVYKFL